MGKWGKIVLSRQIFTEVYTVAENRVVWLMRTTDYRDLTQTDFRRSEIGFNLFSCMHWYSPQPVPGPRLSQSLLPGCKLSSALFVLRCMTLHFAGLKHMFRGVHFAKRCSLSRRLDPSCLFTTVAYLQLFQQLIYLFFSFKSLITIMNSLGARTNHCRTLIKIPSWYLSNNLLT